MEEERNEQIKSYESQMLKKLSSLTQLSSEDMDRFMEEHKKDLALYNGTCPYYTDTHTCTYTHVDIDMKKPIYFRNTSVAAIRTELPQWMIHA